MDLVTWTKCFEWTNMQTKQTKVFRMFSNNLFDNFVWIFLVCVTLLLHMVGRSAPFFDFNFAISDLMMWGHRCRFLTSYVLLLPAKVNCKNQKNVPKLSKRFKTFKMFEALQNVRQRSKMFQNIQNNVPKHSKRSKTFQNVENFRWLKNHEGNLGLLWCFGPFWTEGTLGTNEKFSKTWGNFYTQFCVK